MSLVTNHAAIANRTTSLVLRGQLLERLSAAEPGTVTLVVAPAGSGKSVLVRSWIEHARLAERTAWVSVERGERDAQRIWLSVVNGLHAAAGAEQTITRLTPSPVFDGVAVVDRLLAELRALDVPLVLVIDDLHELSSPDALDQLQRLVAARPPALRMVILTRHDPQLGQHRLRLAGQLFELRARDLAFTLDETRELLAASGINISAHAMRQLNERTEGWAAGVRLAALSIAGHGDPERFVAEFSGSDRTVADFLLAEVLDRQSNEVRQLLLRTSILERVSGPLAAAVAGTAGAESTLLELERAGAFVVSLDGTGSWFRYHHLFADLLRLELRRSQRGEVADLHGRAAAWYEEHGFVADAVRHAQAAEDWDRAAKLLGEHMVSLILDGQEATLGALLAAFPVGARSVPELVLALAGDQIVRGSLDDAARYIALAERRVSDVGADRRDAFRSTLVLARLSIARRQGDYSAVVGDVGTLLDATAVQSETDVAHANDARAVALMDLGTVELWSFSLADARVHLQQGLELARRISRPWVEIGCLGYLALVEGQHSLALQRERAAEGLRIAETYGWMAAPITAVALAATALADLATGRFEEARRWLDLAHRAVRPRLEPATELMVQFGVGLVRAGEGQLALAADAFRAAEQLQDRLRTRHVLSLQARQMLVHTLLRMGSIDEARSTAALMSEQDQDWGESRVALADVSLHDGDAGSALDILAPLLDGTARTTSESTLIHALVLAARCHHRLGQARAAELSVERALEVAEPDGRILPFIILSARDLLESHPRYSTKHAALTADVLDVLSGVSPPARPSNGAGLAEPLSDSELRVLRFLPSNLSASEIGGELFVSTSTVKTHMRHIYAKLDVHRRNEAVQRARELGLLARSARSR